MFLARNKQIILEEVKLDSDDDIFTNNSSRLFGKILAIDPEIDQTLYLINDIVSFSKGKESNFELDGKKYMLVHYESIDFIIK